MATIQSFNSLLRNFIEELCHAFPEDATLHMYFDGFDMLAGSNARKPLELFMEAMGPHGQHIMNKDPQLFSQPLSLSGGIDLKTYWDSPDLSEASRQAIWQYLQTLYIMASTVSALPPEMVAAIDSIASKVESGEVDLAGSLGSLTSMFLGGGAGAGGGADAAMTSLLGSMLGTNTSSLPSNSHSSSHSRKKTKK